VRQIPPRPCYDIRNTVNFFETVQSEGAILVKAIISLYIVVNPSGVSSIFLGLTKDLSPQVRMSIAFRACVGGALTLALFALAGSYVFGLLRVTGPAMQIAGGIFLFGVAFALARGKEQEFFGRLDQAKTEGSPKSLALYPLAIPMIAGPGTITVVLTLSSTVPSGDFTGSISLLMAIASVAALCFLSMMRILKLSQRAGPGLDLVAPRVMGLLLAVVAVQIVIEGVTAVIVNIVKVVVEANLLG
jgi:multiple antibiotic resistance protein